MMYNLANNAESRLASPVGVGDTGLTVYDGSVYPEPPFVVSIGDEIVEVNARDGNTLQDLVRGVEGTTPAAYPQGTRVSHRFTAGTYHKLKDVLEGLFIEEGADWEVDD